MCERKMGTDLKGSEVERNGGSVNSEGKKENFKRMAIRVGKECDKLRDVNMAMAEALKQEMKRARKEEWG